MTTATTSGLSGWSAAPEQTKMVMKNGAIFPAPGCATVKEWRAKYRRPVKPFILATVDIVYDLPEHAWLNQTYVGSVKTRAEALAFRRKVMATKHKGGPVFSGFAADGTCLYEKFLNPPKSTVRTQLIG